MRARTLACLVLSLAPNAASASDCPAPWTFGSGCAGPAGSFVATFLMDHNHSIGDSDRDGDRQGGEVVARLDARANAYVPDGRYVLAARSVMDSSQLAPAAPGRKVRQFDEVPSSVTFGYEGDAVSVYALGGTVNQARAVSAWHDVKLFEHRSAGHAGNRTSPLSGPDELLFGLQARLDEGRLFTATDILKLATVGTAFAQATSIKAEAGAALYAGLGTWTEAPRFTVSDLPSTAMTGSGVWLGAEASWVGYEQLTHAIGTSERRLSVVGGASLSPGQDWPTIAFTTRLALSEQVSGAGRRGVGEYRLQATFPFR